MSRLVAYRSRPNIIIRPENIRNFQRFLTVLKREGDSIDISTFKIDVENVYCFNVHTASSIQWYLIIIYYSIQVYYNPYIAQSGQIPGQIIIPSKFRKVGNPRLGWPGDPFYHQRFTLMNQATPQKLQNLNSIYNLKIGPNYIIYGGAVNALLEISVDSYFLLMQTAASNHMYIRHGLYSITKWEISYRSHTEPRFCCYHILFQCSYCKQYTGESDNYIIQYIVYRYIIIRIQHNLDNFEFK